MERKITVKGVGRAVVQPDYVEISIELRAMHKTYEKAMAEGNNQILNLTSYLKEAGIPEKDIKTTDFDVEAEYDQIEDEYRNYTSVFKGYKVSHDVKIGFSLDMERLDSVLYAIATSEATPRFSIEFTVQDSTAVQEELLRSAAANAKKKAEILCNAVGNTLGELISIEYSWKTISFVSDTIYEAPRPVRRGVKSRKSWNFHPDDIDVTDTAVFIWSIE